MTDPNSTPLCCFIRCGTSYTCLPLCLVRKCLGENSSQENRKDPPSRSCLFGLIDKADVAIETCPSTPRVLHKEFRGLLMSILKAVCSSLASGQIPCCVDIFHWTASGVPQLASCDHMINHAVNILCKLESAAFGPVALYVKPRALPLGLGNFPQQDLITACVTSSGNFWFFLIRLYCRLCFKRSEPAVWTPFPA